MLLKPERLSPGDKIAIVAPASAPPDPNVIEKCAAAVEALGFRPALSRNVHKRRGFLAGSDRERASDLMRSFQDRSIKGILCVRGGYGTSRLIPLLDYGIIKANPKVLVGYSDLTSLHCALLRYARLVSFHGPMLNSDLIKADMPEFTRKSLLRSLMQLEPSGSIRQGYKGPVKILRKGRAEGVLVGGNLTLLCATLGTPYQPSLKSRLLFLEDLDEVPYRFDRMLTQLLNAGILQEVAGIAIGINENCNDPKAGTTSEYRQTLEDVLSERLRPLGVPVVMNLPFGHVSYNATLPIGVRAVLDANRGDLVITERAVS